MSCCTISTKSIGQRFPKSDRRTILVDALLPQTLSAEVGKVFSYKLTSVERADGKLVQHGCGPNFQGDRITLCTCMRYHRTWPSIDKGTWIAGFSGNPDNELFYLMKIGAIADNFAEFWTSGFLPDVEAKSACKDIFGDAYVPRSLGAPGDPHDPRSYEEPIKNHKHHNQPDDYEWHKDIRYWTKDKNRKHKRTIKPRLHKLLIGEPGKSFVWEHPKYRHKGKLPRMKFRSLTSFIGHLVPL